MGGVLAGRAQAPPSGSGSRLSAGATSLHTAHCGRHLELCVVGDASDPGPLESEARGACARPYRQVQLD